MPGQFWSRKEQFKTFSAEFWFLDGNIAYVSPGTSHNICQVDEVYCPARPFGGGAMDSCGISGPSTAASCEDWFHDFTAKQHDWFVEHAKASTADWRIIVTHYPHSQIGGGHGRPALVWPKLVGEMGIDLIITGHEHLQKVHYKDGFSGGVGNLGETAWVISGGGGGITSEAGPTHSGEDDAYGFMDIELSLEKLVITAISHTGVSR